MTLKAEEVSKETTEFINNQEEEIRRKKYDNVYRNARMQLSNEDINVLTEVFAKCEVLPDGFKKYKKCQFAKTITVFDMNENPSRRSPAISNEEPLRFWRDLAQQMAERYSVCAVVEKEIYVFLLEKREEQIQVTSADYSLLDDVKLPADE